LFCLVDDIHTLVDVIIINSIWANLVSQSTFSLGVATIVVAQGKERLYCNCYPTDVSSCQFLDVFTCNLTTFFINVLTWHRQQKTSKAFLYQFCIPCINRDIDGIIKSACYLHLEAGCHCRGRFSYAWSFIGFTSPFLYASSDWWRFQYLVVLLPLCGPPLLGYLLAWTLFLFLSLSWVLSFYKVW
jgi:hypothetical protein